MIFLFFPAVTVGAACLVDAALVILCNEIIRKPILADYIAVVGENVWLSSEVLPVVSVCTECFVVLLIEWAPLCFVVEQIKIQVLLHFVNEPSF